MDIPTVPSRCILSLKIIGKMMGLVEMFAYVGLILAFFISDIFLAIPFMLQGLCVNISWLYGIEKKKPHFMLPALVCPVIISLIGIGVFFAMPIVVATYVTFILLTKGILSNIFLTNLQSFIAAWIFDFIVTTITTYLAILQYSIYKFVKDESSIASNGCVPIERV